MHRMYYTLATTALGDVGVIWRERNSTPTVARICLPVEHGKMENVVRKHVPGSRMHSHTNVDMVCRHLREYLAGDVPVFSLAMLDMCICTDFQRKVLDKARLIPRGKVCTYKGLAERIGVPGGARAVGTALASNPFPLVIPCHRVIRTGGSLGGFGGGLEMKKTLLRMEGVEIDAKGKVSTRYLW